MSLHGDIRRINGALPIALCAKPGNTLVVPRGNEKECCMVRGLPNHNSTRITVAESLEETLRFMQGKTRLRNALAENPKFESVIQPPPDFPATNQHPQSKRAPL